MSIFRLTKLPHCLSQLLRGGSAKISLLLYTENSFDDRAITSQEIQGSYLNELLWVACQYARFFRLPVLDSQSKPLGEVNHSEPAIHMLRHP